MDLQVLLHGLAALLLIVFAVSIWVTLLESGRIRRASEQRSRNDPDRGVRDGGDSDRDDERASEHDETSELQENPAAPGIFGFRRSPNVDYPAVLVEVAARLQAGVPTATAWAASWRRVTKSDPGEVGVDGVPEALRKEESLVAQVVVASTRFSAFTGAPLKDVLSRVATALTEMERAEDAQQTAFAGPRLSTKVLTFLPVAGLLGASILGVEPFAWFLSGPLPMFLAVLGVGLTVSGHLITKGMVDRAAKISEDQVVAPIYCDLVVSGMRGGASVPTVLKALGEATENSDYGRVGEELMLGSNWEEAWNPLPGGGGLLKQGLQPAWEDGVSSVAILTTLADQTRARSVADAKQQAERLSVKLAFPLATLLLPAFILLGLLPIFMSLFGSDLLPAFSG